MAQEKPVFAVMWWLDLESACASALHQVQVISRHLLLSLGSTDDLNWKHGL